jgi:signal-transduction protein with cAMP-binding, CBS, and nucleotidyltransferase domain
VRSRGNQEIMFTDIFFDFRAISDSPELAPALRRHVTAATRDNLPFLAQISWLQHDRTNSVDLFGQLIANDGPEKDAIDLWTASGHQGSPNPSSTRISPFAGLTEWSC